MQVIVGLDAVKFGTIAMAKPDRGKRENPRTRRPGNSLSDNFLTTTGMVVCCREMSLVFS